VRCRRVTAAALAGDGYAQFFGIGFHFGKTSRLIIEKLITTKD
jgi:hypothetical protein